MDLSDPVDAAALRMYNELRAYIIALQNGETPDATALTEAINAYTAAVDDNLLRPSSPTTSLRRPSRS